MKIVIFQSLSAREIQLTNDQKIILANLEKLKTFLLTLSRHYRGDQPSGIRDLVKLHAIFELKPFKGPVYRVFACCL